MAASVALLPLLLAPLGGASAGEGVFTTGGVAIPPGTQADFTPFAAYVGNASSVDGFELKMPSATASLYQRTFAQIPTPRGPVLVENPAGFQNRTWRLEDATLRILGKGGASDEREFFGLNPESATLQVIPLASADARASPVSSFGSIERDRDTEPESIDYFVREMRPHLFVDFPCQGRYVGLGGIKLAGLKVEISHSGGGVVYDTGTSESSPVETTFTYLFIRFNEPASLTFDTGAASLEMAAAHAHMIGEGPLSFAATSGEFRTSEGSYLSPVDPDEVVTLEGAFELGMVPLSDGREARLSLTGDFEPQGLAFKPAPVSPGRFGISWFLVFGAALLAVTLVAGAAGGIGAGFTLAQHASRVQPKPAQLPFTAEDCLATAHDALAHGDHPEALAWLRRAHALAPSSARVAADLAYCLAEMGCRDDALAWYGKAHELSADGEAALNAARTAREAGKDATLVMGWLAAALDRTPHLVEEVVGEFPAIRALPGWADVEARAWARYRDSSGGTEDGA